jgi:flagellar biosynthesis/type III secretory pathway M-ring protein FliF/YscJ
MTHPLTLSGLSTLYDAWILLGLLAAHAIVGIVSVRMCRRRVRQAREERQHAARERHSAEVLKDQTRHYCDSARQHADQAVAQVDRARTERRAAERFATDARNHLFALADAVDHATKAPTGSNPHPWVEKVRADATPAPVK